MVNIYSLNKALIDLFSVDGFLITYSYNDEDHILGYSLFFNSNRLYLKKGYSFYF